MIRIGGRWSIGLSKGTIVSVRRSGSIATPVRCIRPRTVNRPAQTIDLSAGHDGTHDALVEVDSSSLVASGSVWVEVESDVGSVWLNTETLGVAVSPGGAEPDPVPTQVVMDIDSPAYRMGYSIDPDVASSGELYATGMLDLSSGAIYDDDGAVVGVLSGDGPPDDVRFVETDQGVGDLCARVGWVGWC